jgi:predicted acyl esterase
VTHAPMEGEASFALLIEEETEITGPMAAKLFVSTESEDADLFLVVRVFRPDGREVTFQGALEPHSPFAHGWLRLSHRRLDPERSAEHRPYHPHVDREPAVPGEIYEVDVEIWPSCLVIPAGYRLELTVQGRDYRFSDEVERVSWFTMTGVGPFKHDHPEDRPAETFGAPVTLHTGAEHEAYLLVPVIPTR